MRSVCVPVSKRVCVGPLISHSAASLFECPVMAARSRSSRGCGESPPLKAPSIDFYIPPLTACWLSLQSGPQAITQSSGSQNPRVTFRVLDDIFGSQLTSYRSTRTRTRPTSPPLGKLNAVFGKARHVLYNLFRVGVKCVLQHPLVCRQGPSFLLVVGSFLLVVFLRS